MAAVAVALVTAGSGRGAGRGTGGSTTSSTTRLHRTGGRAPPMRELDVTTRTLALVDPTRPVVEGGTELAPDRPLPTTIWLPAGPGPFPLVVFVHGFAVDPLTYRRFCATLASAGYVVAAPGFPLEDPDLPYALDRSELPAEAADVSFVITAVEHGPVAPKVDPTRIAVVGHSDGADVALMVVYERGTIDPRVGAVVADAPDPMVAAVVPSSVPLLLVQGTADTVVPYSASQTVFGQVRAPDDYLSLVGAGHLPPIAGGTVWTPVLDAAVADFLDSAVAGRGPGHGALAGELGASPLVVLRTSP